MKRRDFLKAIPMACIGTSLLGGSFSGAAQSSVKSSKVQFKMGLCADVHQDLIPDATARISEFVRDMEKRKADLIVQLGDFCQPKKTNEDFIVAWNRFEGGKYHIMGNHDRDGGYSYEKILEFWGGSLETKIPYYSFDAHGYHFIVLNGNDKNPEKSGGGYPTYIGNEQKQWLADDLASTSLPTFVFCHQPFDLDVVRGKGDFDNGPEIRKTLEDAKGKDGKPKVKAVFTGHYHSDYHLVINDIWYIQINSMSYCWISDKKYFRSRYDEATEKKYPHLKNCLVYQAPVWAFLTVFEDGRFEMLGKESDFLPPTPESMGMPSLWNGVPLTASISGLKSWKPPKRKS